MANRFWTFNIYDYPLSNGNCPHEIVQQVPLVLYRHRHTAIEAVRKYIQQELNDYYGEDSPTPLEKRVKVPEIITFDPNTNLYFNEDLETWFYLYQMEVEG